MIWVFLAVGIIGVINIIACAAHLKECAFQLIELRKWFERNGNRQDV